MVFGCVENRANQIFCQSLLSKAFFFKRFTRGETFH